MAPAPDRILVMAPAPDRSPVMAPAPEHIPVMAPALEFSSESDSAPDPVMSPLQPQSSVTSRYSPRVQ